jgi:hypothetical protein
MDEAPPAAASRTWRAIAPDGSEHTVCLRIALPAEQPSGDWSAAASLAPIEPKIRQIHGVDAWQATSLAMRFLADRVEHLAEQGWRFYWDRDDAPASATQLIEAWPRP